MDPQTEERLRRRIEREREARKAAEKFAEERTRELFEANRKLNQWNRELEGRIEEATAELRVRTEELRTNSSRLARALSMRDEFIASVSHELRSPLHAVMGLAEAMLDEALGEINDEQKDALDTIYSSGEHLLSLINDILDLSRLGAGKADLERQQVDVEEVCTQAMHLVAPPAESAGVELRISLADEVDTVFACPRRLKQMLVNLLSNAIKFTRHGQAAGLEVKLDSERGAVAFSVWDNGIGIERKDLAGLFTPFTQLQSGLDREFQGSGLGLMLVLRMAELHGGSVTVESEAGQGSRFTVHLPVREGQALLSADEELGGPLALLVDDSEVTRLLVRRLLSTRGYRVEEAEDGVLALDAARKLLPDIILMDIQMPRLGGLDAIRLIRADKTLRKTPVVAITGLTYAGDRERCLAAGADEYLEKPVHPARLFEVIKRLAPSSAD